MDHIKLGTGWTVFTKENCGYCKKVKKLIPDALFIPSDEYITYDRDAFLAKMDELTGRKYRTFPMVFRDRVFVGGHAETLKYVEKIEAFIPVDF